MTPHRNRVASGSRVTLADVAAAAGVDRSVVSRVINNDPRLVIREETRSRVLDAIRGLGYHPNAAARSLRTAQAGAVGLVIPDFTNPIYAAIIQGAEAAARAADSLLLTGTTDAARGAEQYLRLLASGRVDGLLLAARGQNLPTALVRALVDTGRPLVALNQKIAAPAPCILLDDEAAALLAVRHLLELGHTRIAHISGPASVDTAQRRRSGFLRAMEEAGIEPRSEYVVAADYTPEGGQQALAGLLRLRRPPTAVFVANVASAIGALHGARAAHRSVPEELSLVAVHDIPLAAYLNPALTTVRMPLQEMGRTGVQMLLEQRITRRTQVVRQPMRLVVRESTAPPGRRRS